MRTPEITREDLPPEQRGIWDHIAETRGRVAGPFQVLLQSPELASRVINVGTLLRYEGSLSAGTRELAIISTAREFDAELEWAAHTPLARKGGVSDEAIEAVRDRKPLDGLSESEAVVIQYCRELFGKKRVGQTTFDRALALFGRPGLVEITVLMGYYSLIACCLNAFEVEPLADLADRLPGLPSA